MSVADLGPLDWRIAITDSNGRPTPEFQRRWATQRSNNNLINDTTFGTGAPTGTPDNDGTGYIDTSTTPYQVYIGFNGTWHHVGVVNFVDLQDAPHTYTGSGLKLVRVNSGATAVEFAGVTSVLDSIGSTQGDILYRDAANWAVLAPGTLGQVLTSGGASANPTWSASGASGLVLISRVTTSGSQSNVTFSTIPGTYQDLMIVITGAATIAAVNDTISCQFNGDTAAHYSGNTMIKSGSSSVGGPDAVNASAAILGYLPGSTGVANDNSISQCRIGHYANTSFNKTVSSVGTIRNANSANNLFEVQTSYWWTSTAAITSIKIFPTASNFVNGSVVSLYGIS